MQLIAPLLKGDTVLIISPAKSIDSLYLDKATAMLNNWGLKVEIGKSALKSHKYFAGTDPERAEDLQWALNHPTAKAILCSRGGYGTIRIIDKVNFDLFTKNPKWIIGFSDITVLHNKVHTCFSLPTIHGVVPLQLDKLKADSETVETLRKALFDEGLEIAFLPNSNNRIGNCTAKIVGGNLAIMESLIGTDIDIDTDGKILFVEEISEYAYKLDRMLWSLKKSGKLKNLAGLVVGGLTDIKECEETFGCSVEELMASFTDGSYPVAFGFPAGHQLDNRAIVFGTEYSLRVEVDSCILSKK